MTKHDATKRHVTNDIVFVARVALKCRFFRPQTEVMALDILIKKLID